MTAQASSNKPRRLQQEFLPGSTPIPNWIIDEVMEEMPESVLRVFLYLYRKTVGWNNKTEEKSLTQIMDDCNLSRNSSIYAVRILCDCWGFWKKFRGKKGQRSSVFMVAAIGSPDEARARIVLTNMIYGADCPTIQQLKDLPPTKDLYRAALTDGKTTHGDDWWMVPATAQWFNECTTGGSTVELAEVQ